MMLSSFSWTCWLLLFLELRKVSLSLSPTF
jgi:hypothetical protein